MWLAWSKVYGGPRVQKFWLVVVRGFWDLEIYPVGL